MSFFSLSCGRSGVTSLSTACRLSTAAPSSIPPTISWGGNGVTENLLPHVLGCLYLLLAYGLTFPRLLRWLEHDLPIFFHYATRRFLHLAWLAPLLFFLSVVFFAIETAQPETMSGWVGIVSVAGGIAMMAAFRSVRFAMTELSAPHIYAENRALSERLARLRLAAWRRFLASDDVSPGREEGRS